MTTNNSQDLVDNIMDIFYRAGLEHLIQEDEGVGRFCETCQAEAQSMCFGINAQLTVAKHSLKKLLQQKLTAQAEAIKGKLEKKEYAKWSREDELRAEGYNDAIANVEAILDSYIKEKQ